MMKVFLDDDDDDDELINHDEIMTFSLEKTSDQITPFVVDEDHDEMLLVLSFDFDDEDHQMDLNQNLKNSIEFIPILFPPLSLSCDENKIQTFVHLLFSPTFITRRVHLSKDLINNRSNRLICEE